MKNLILFAMVYLHCLIVFAEQQETVEISSKNGEFQISISRNGIVAETCKLGALRTATASTYQRVRFSFDRKAIIFSDSEYLPVSFLANCGDKILVPKSVAPVSGMVGDVNMASKLYISLEVVGVRPLTFLAVVAKLRKTQNLINLPGAYLPKQSAETLRKRSFTYSDGTYPKISLDGRFVAPNGSIDCAEKAYPGVWDITNDRKVRFHDSPEKIKEKCDALF